MFILGFATFAALQSSVPSSVETSSPWAVESTQVGCTLTRTFGADLQGLRVRIDPDVLGNSLSLEVLRPGLKPDLLPKDFALLLAPSGQRVRMYVNPSRSSAAENGVKLWIDNNRVEASEILGLLGRADTIQIPMRQEGHIEIALSLSADELRSLRECQAGIVAAWGIEAAEIAAVASPARGDGVNWSLPDSYPEEALRAEHEGTSVIAWRADVTGRASDCRVVVTSGYKELDRAACGMIDRTARYPIVVRDTDGKPVASWHSRKVVWRLPS